MASRATRYITPVVRSGFRYPRTAFRASGRRGMATATSSSTQSSDLPWIIGSGLVFVPTIAWILSTGKEKQHAHPAPNAPKEHVEVPETVEESPKEPVSELVAAELTPEPVPEEATPESTASESGVSDDDGVVISKEDLEESINKAVDADAPKEAEAVEVTFSEPTPAPSESEPAKDSQAATPSKQETTESTPPASEGASTEKKEAKSQ